MKLSKTRLSEIENLPENDIDTSDIPELDDDFWENAQPVVPENYLVSITHCAGILNPALSRLGADD